MNVPQLPAGWKLASLGTVVVPERTFAEGPERHRPYVGLEQIETVTGRITGFDDSIGADVSAFAFDQRHVLYAKLRPYLNKVALPEHEGRCSTEAIPLLPSKEIDRRYLAAFLKRNETVAAVMAEKTGSRMPRADMSVLLSMLIPLPPLGEQHRISERLDAALVDIETARNALSRQREALRALGYIGIEQALGGRRIAADRDSLTVGPEWVPLATVARLESGHTPSRKHPEWWGGDIPWISLPDIRAMDGRTAATTSESTNEFGLANSSARLLPTGTVVFCRDVNVGYVTVTGVPMATSQHFVNWVPGPKLRDWYLAHVLMSARRYLKDLSEGSIIKTIYMPQLKALRIRLPAVDEQDAILRKIEDIRTSTQAASRPLDRQSAELNVLASSLLTAAFQGKL